MRRVQALLNRRKGYPLRHALPLQYRRALIGLPVFILGGLGDLAWHTVFRVEDRIEAVTSPTHLVLGLGVCLFISGPVTSALANRGRIRTLRDQLPTIFAIAAMVEFFHLGTCYVFDPFAANAFIPPPALSQAPDYFTATTLGMYKVSIGLLVVMLNAVLVAGIVVWLNSRFAIAFGGNALLLVLAEIFEAAAITNDTPMLAIHIGMGCGCRPVCRCVRHLAPSRGIGRSDVAAAARYPRRSRFVRILRSVFHLDDRDSGHVVDVDARARRDDLGNAARIRRRDALGAPAYGRSGGL